MKKKILIYGPIGDFGGRDVEVNIIAKSLIEKFEVRIFSSVYISSNSYSILDIENPNFSSFQIELYKKHFFLRFLASMLGIKNLRKKKKNYAFIKNKISKLFFNFRKHKLEILEEEIEQADLVFVCSQLTSKFLKELVDYSELLGKPCLVRTTGTIKFFKKENFKFLKKVTRFIHHSEKNALNLNTIISLPYSIIDQCALKDSKLIELSIDKQKPLRIGYLGRLSKEKGILELFNFFGNQDEFKLIVAGNGPLLKFVDGQKNINYIGQVQPDNLNDFFNKIDVLIVSSFEESGPLVGLEAMAAGKIIVSTNVGAMKDRFIGTQNNFWFEVQAIHELEEILRKINQIDISELNSIAESNRLKYLENYQFSAIKEKYLELVSNYC